MEREAELRAERETYIRAREEADKEEEEMMEEAGNSGNTEKEKKVTFFLFTFYHISKFRLRSFKNKIIFFRKIVYT